MENTNFWNGFEKQALSEKYIAQRMLARKLHSSVAHPKKLPKVVGQLVSRGSDAMRGFHEYDLNPFNQDFKGRKEVLKHFKKEYPK